MRSSRSFTLQGVEIQYSTRTTKGNDPTVIQTYRIIRPGWSDIILTEFFGDWQFELDDIDERGLTHDEITSRLTARALPTLMQIEDENGNLEEAEAAEYIDDGIYGEA